MIEPALNRDGLLALARYNAYANRLILTTAAQLDSDALMQPTSPSQGSVHGLLQHMLLVEAGFLARCQGQQGRPIDAPTVETLQAAWQQVAAETEAFLLAVSDTELGRVLPVRLRDHTFQFAPWQLLLQAFSHSAHHRGELSIVLSGLGYPLPTLDAIIYFAEQSGQRLPW